MNNNLLLFTSLLNTFYFDIGLQRLSISFWEFCNGKENSSSQTCLFDFCHCEAEVMRKARIEICNILHNLNRVCWTSVKRLECLAMGSKSCCPPG